MVFSSFDKDQIVNIHWHCWKERLNKWKLAKFKGDMLKAREDIAPQSRKAKILQRFGAPNLPSPYTVQM